MFVRFIIPSLIIIYMSGAASAQNKPFPQALNYENCIKPNNVTQSQLNNNVTDFYNYWKQAYLRRSNGQTSGGYYIYSHANDSSKKSVSEAHGYGMMIMALMAGYDDSAKIYFDGMYAMYNDHRSIIDHDLMSWIISPDENPADDEDSATDGDMDIAYALLLADRQWGSTATINYQQQAQRLITDGIKQSNTNNSRLMLGDWWIYDSKWQWASRSSDWMPDHLRAYYQATGDLFWLDLADSIYSLIHDISMNYSADTGLMPDFVDQQQVQPAPPYFLESEYDGQYNWNACRFPWRMAVDWAHYNTPQAKSAENKMLAWLKSSTAGDPANIKPGYLLNGAPIPDRDYTSNAFTAPFIAACIVDPAHQQYLNDGWMLIKDIKEAYYEDTINLLCLLLISGNWWPLTDASSPVNKRTDRVPATAALKQNFPNPFNSKTIINYELRGTAKVNLSIFNLVGKKITTLVSKIQHAGRYKYEWDASGFASGVYFYTLQSGAFRQTNKMILLR